LATFDKHFNAEKLSVHVLRDSISDFLLSRGHAAKISDIVREAGTNYNSGAKLIRHILKNDESFVSAERRFNFRYRTDFNRPFDGDIRNVLEGVGLPLEISNLANELALLNVKTQEYFLDLLPRFTLNRDDYFVINNEFYGLINWILKIGEGDSKDDVLDANFFDDFSEIESDLEKIAAVKLSGDDTKKMSEAIIDEIGPVSHKVLSLALWNVLGDNFDSLKLFNDLFLDDEFVLLSGPIWARQKYTADAPAKLKKLSALADKELVEEEELTGDYIANAEDISEISGYLLDLGTAERLTDIIVNVLEYNEDSSRFMSIRNTLFEEMNNDRRFERVGEETFAAGGMIPEFVTQVPDELLPEFVDSSLYKDSEADIELIDEGLDAGLAAFIHDPYYEDFGGEHEVELADDISVKSKTIMSLTYAHRLMGTLKLRQMDIPFFLSETSYASLTLKNDNSEILPFKMWLNNEELIMTNLSEWYRDMGVKVGSQITFRKDSCADCYIITLEPKADKNIEIPDVRIDELLELSSKVQDETWSIYEIVTNILSDYKLGLSFLNLWSEVNVVRRTPKRIIASILSYYEGFTVTKAGNWKFDTKKIGRKRTDKDDFVM